jgi:hypothetical protein
MVRRTITPIIRLAGRLRQSPPASAEDFEIRQNYRKNKKLPAINRFLN